MDDAGVMVGAAKQIESLLYDGLFPEAAARIKEALQSGASETEGRFLLAKLACLLGQFSQAEKLLVEVLKTGENRPQAARTLAFLLKARGQYQLALQFAEAANEGMPGQVGLIQLIGELALGLGDLERGKLCLEEAASLEPNETTLGIAALNEGAIGEALRLFHVSLAAQSTSVRSPGPYAAALHQAGSLDGACRILRQAILLNPTVEIYFVQLGDLLNRYPRSVDASECFKSALRLSPRSASAYFRLGTTLLELGSPGDAIACLLKTSEIRPEWTTPLPYLAGAYLQIGRQDEAVATLRRVLQLNPKDAAAQSQLIHTLHYVLRDGAASHYVEASNYAERFEDAALVFPRAPVERAERSRIRIGYVSSDLRNHSVAFFVEPLLRSHNRARFEVVCYSTKSGSDSVTERLRGLADRWCDASGLTDEMLARRIREDQIDVLVDLNNHTSGNRLLAFARRPAPVQVTMIGLMQTTGLRSMGYRITDWFLDPEDGEEVYYSEEMVRMRSGPLVFMPPRDAPAVSDLPVDQAKRFTFGCTNELVKVTPSVVAVWAKILLEAPESRFLFFGRTGNFLKRALREFGVEEQRIVEVPRQTMGEYLQQHAGIDLALDPFPYNGLTVTLLSCWMGVPCVTLCGATPAARAGAAVMRRLGLDEFVAETEDEYVRRAVSLSQNKAHLREVREGLRRRVEVHFTDAQKYVRELEGRFEQMLAAEKC